MPLIDDTNTTIPVKGDDRLPAVVRRAHQRFIRCRSWESTARVRWLDDLKFANGDSYNNYQWPDAIYQTRGDRPALTVNEVRQHNLHVINEAKQNKSGVKYRAVGDGATEEAAQTFEGIYRHIASISNGQMAQGRAIEFQVNAGLGFTTIDSDYVDQKGFDQEIYIKGVPNPLAVYLDCDAQELDGSDARYGFIFADRPRDEMEKKYPILRDRGVGANAVDGDDGGWLREDHIRESRYYEVEEKADELIGDDEGNTVLRSEAPAALVKQWEAEAEARGAKLRKRPLVTKKVRWYMIAGDIVVDEEDVPGTSIPIIPWVGEVTIIDQQLDRKGHTRALISAQQMENYNWSAAVEYGALQGKTPWLASQQATEGYETYYASLNTVTPAWMPWNERDDDGKENTKPERIQPPVSAPAYLDGVKMANAFMMAASGQHEAEMGKPGNERSGRAINERQRQSDRATYHFTDSQALAIRRQAQIILEWVPVIYDTARVIKILGEDGSEAQVQIDPTAQAAHQKAAEGAANIFNPGVGRYEVVPDTGPDYATQRQEAFDAIVQILTQAPALIDKIGDLLFKVADFPLADEIAERLKPGLPPAAQQAIAELQKQLQNKNRLLSEAMQALTEERLKVKGRDAEDNVKAFDADTRRLGVIKDMLPLDPADMQRLIHETVRQALQDNLGPIIGDLRTSLGQDADPAGASGGAALPLQVPDVGQEAATPGGQ